MEISSENIQVDKSKNYSLSYLRALSCIAIIVIHTVFSTILIYRETMDAESVSFYRSIVNNMMWAVPCFLMISGALLLDANRRMTLEKIFKKYILRLFFALLFFGVIYSLCDMWMNREWTIMAFLNGMYRILGGNSWSHLWYIYCMIGLYLLLPFFRKITVDRTEKEMVYLLLLGVIFLSIMPLLKEWGITIGFSIPISTIYPFYFFAGYYLLNFGGRFSRKLCLILFVLSTASIIGVTYLQFLGMKAVPENLTGYASILVIVQSLSVFNLIRGLECKGTGAFGKLLILIDKNSFAIYLIHLIFVRILLRVFHLNPFQDGLWMVIVWIIGNLVVSWIVACIMKKIPGIRTII